MPDRRAVTQSAEPWPEQSVPPDVAIDCDAFGLGGHGRLVWGEGDAKAPLIFLLDNPGARETPAGVPYVCGTRLTLRSAATEAVLDVDHIYVTFLIKCQPRRAYDRKKAHSVGLKYLYDQLRTHHPEVLVLFGDVVTRVVTGDETTSVRALRNTEITAYGIPTLVTYHPLAARRRPNLYPLLVDDLARARSLLHRSRQTWK